MSDTTLLIDTDIIAYRVACRHEQATAFGKVVSDIDTALATADEVVAEFTELLKADRVILCLSDGPQGGTTADSQTPEFNFRYGVLPTYKGNRKAVERPELLAALKLYYAEEYESKGYPALEADDVMGVLATHPHLIPGKKIIVSEDKDMRTIPGFLYAPHRASLGVIEISELDADRFHLWQTICGDATDGYSGAKGVGPASEYALDIIGADREELWDITWQAFASKKLNEADAIQQAQCARILRAEDFDIRSKEIKLWLPEMLEHG